MNSTQFLTTLQELLRRKAAEKGLQDGEALQLPDLFDEPLVAAILEEQRVADAERARIAAEAEAAAIHAAQLALAAPNLTGIIG